MKAEILVIKKHYFTRFLPPTREYIISRIQPVLPFRTLVTSQTDIIITTPFIDRNSGNLSKLFQCTYSFLIVQCTAPSHSFSYSGRKTVQLRNQKRVPYVDTLCHLSLFVLNALAVFQPPTHSDHKECFIYSHTDRVYSIKHCTSRRETL